MRINAIHLVLAVTVLMSGCARQATEEPPTTDATAASESLHETVEAYFDAYLQLNPTYATALGDQHPRSRSNCLRRRRS